MNLIFNKVQLKDKVVVTEYTKPFALLAEAAKATQGSKIANLDKIAPKIFELRNHQ